MVLAKKYVLVKEFDGFPNDENIELQDEELPALTDDEVLFEAVYLSVDPYMRVFPIPIGSVMIGTQVAKVVESNNEDYAAGDMYVANFGWRTHTIANPSNNTELNIKKIPELGDLSPSLALGAAGMPGETAYLALVHIGRPQEGETVVVTAAAGAVGSVVGQIANIRECTTIGYAGTDAKVAWLKEIGFTYAYNYKTCDISESLKESAPNGVDIYYDNVGGHVAGKIVNNHMNVRGRVACVGSISSYNKGTEEGPYPFGHVLFKRLTMKGFIHFDEKPVDTQKANAQLIDWIHEGKIKVREHVVGGFSQMREAFYGLFKGENVGKAVVKV